MYKSIFKSKTMWFGLLQALLGAYGLISGQLDAAQAQTLIITGLSTMALRTATDKPVGLP